MKIDAQKNVSFKAIPVARITTNISNNKQVVELFKLGQEDLPFVGKMLRETRLRQLYPNEENYRGFEQWEGIINSACSHIGEQNVILAVHDKRPCGVMACCHSHKSMILSSLAKWRSKVGTDVNYVGKILMSYFFKKGADKCADMAMVNPARFSTRGKSCIYFYGDLGFTKYSGNVLKLDDCNFNHMHTKLNKYFEKYEEIKKAPSVDLNKVCCLDYNDTLVEKLQKLISKFLIYTKITNLFKK